MLSPQIRRRDPEFPDKAMNYRTEYVPPALTAHSDYSRDGGHQVLSYSFPGQEEWFKDKKFDLIKLVNCRSRSVLSWTFYP